MSRSAWEAQLGGAVPPATRSSLAVDTAAPRASHATTSVVVPIFHIDRTGSETDQGRLFLTEQTTAFFSHNRIFPGEALLPNRLFPGTTKWLIPLLRSSSLRKLDSRGPNAPRLMLAH